TQPQSRLSEWDFWLEILNNNLGVCLLNLKDYDTAIEYFTRAIKSNPRLRSSYLSRSVAWYKKGEEGKSIDDTERGFAL
ncbi:MAG: tetratricopeptide repeat protein, partial [Nanoarchaeota archaeon]